MAAVVNVRNDTNESEARDDDYYYNGLNVNTNIPFGQGRKFRIDNE